MNYLKLHENNYQKGKCGISWHSFGGKCLKWHQLNPDLLNETFEFSYGWIINALKTNSIKNIKLHGEANEITPEQKAEEMDPCLVKLQTLLEENDIPPECVYNAEQTGWYYQKILNTLYVDIEHNRLHHRCNQIKEKTRITVMLCTSSSSARWPLDPIIKSKNSKILSLVTPPHP